MGASEKLAAALHPDGPSGVHAVLAAADAVAQRVLGFLVQCETCPQKALIATQVDTWQCPRCTAASEPYTGPESGYDIGGRACAEAAAMFPQHTKIADLAKRVQVTADDPDDAPDLGKIIG